MLDFGTGLTLTDAVMAVCVKRAEGIAAYFGAENLMPLSERVSQLEKPLAILEDQKIGKMKNGF